MAWVTSGLWMCLALLIASAACRAIYGTQYREIVRETLLWWLPDPKDSLRPGRRAKERGGADL